MTDFSLKFYNRLAIVTNTDRRFGYYTEPTNYTEDKDSLSVRVAYIKVNVSRTRKTISTDLINDPSSPSSDNNDDNSNVFNKKSTTNDVKFSVLADIGATSFIYDMRNIKEVFVFPKIWYRRSLVRRLFFGEEASMNYNNANNVYGSGSDFDMKHQKKNNDNIKMNEPESIKADKSLIQCSNVELKTLVLVSINLAALEVRMNIGNVMGNVW
jgi:hypothetical protein